MRIILLFFSICFLHSSIKGQEMYGLSQSNYSPATTVFHNPTSIVDSKVLLDVHLIGYDLFLYNNYAHLDPKEFSFFKFLTSASLPKTKFDNSREKYFLFSSNEVQLFSAAYQYKEHGFAVNARIRTFVDMRNLPEVFTSEINFAEIKSANYVSNPNNLNRALNANNMTIATLAYDDISLSYANIVKHFDREMIIVGGSIKYLLGVAGGGLKSNSLDFNLDSNGTFTYSNLDISACGAQGNVFGNWTDWFAGNGLGADFGITYKKMLNNVTYYDPLSLLGGCKPFEYKWKVNASIIDFGMINFNSKSSFTEVKASAGVVENFSSTNPSTNPERFISQELGPNLDVTQKQSFSMWIPTSLVLQFDYNFQNNFYLSGQYTHGFYRKNIIGIQRPHVLTFMPRYESRYFEISFPVSLYNFQEIRTGVMIRIAGLAMGTDKLGTIFSITDVTGYDFYLHYSLKFYKRKGCGQKEELKERDVSKCRKS